MKIHKIFFALAMICAIVGSTHVVAVSSAHAASCGGVNQKACPVFKKGPQCNPWTYKVGKYCRACGGPNQKTCPAIAKGPPCKPGLKKKSGRCMTKAALACGGLNQKACPPLKKGPPCKPWLYNSKGYCRACGGLNQKSCPPLAKGPQCKPGLAKLNGRCVSQAAAACGGLNQRACPPLKKGPPCKTWLYNSKGFCRACGGLNQKSCPPLAKGPQCKPNLVKLRGLCVTPSKAAACGGLNQLACPPSKPGPQCRQWLRKVGNYCRPCGDRNQQSCPALAKGTRCKPGLAPKKGRCVFINCGRNNQRACKVTERVPACDINLVNIRGKCMTRQAAGCGGYKQRPCPINLDKSKLCNPGLKVDLTKNICVKKVKKYKLKALGQQCIKQLKPALKPITDLAKCVAKAPAIGALKAMAKKKDKKGFARLMKDVVLKHCLPAVTATPASTALNTFKSISVGISGELGAGVGAAGEFFIALQHKTPLKPRVHLYESIGWKVGWFAGGDVSVFVGGNFGNSWGLDGEGHAVSASFKAIAGAGVSASLNPATEHTQPSCGGVSASVGAGVAANAGAVSNSVTLKIF